IDSQCRRISSLNNDAHAECRDDMCHCAPARSALRWDGWAGTYSTPHYMDTGPFSMISLCVAPLDEVRATGYSEDRHIMISPVVAGRSYTFTIDAVNVGSGSDCTDAVKISGYSSVTDAPEDSETDRITLTAVSDRIYLSFNNAVNSDCLVTVRMI
ncbi:hypothetical protein KY362_03775, partial [Candidatus Woesearchaeota archaeon]|nr:hypothetical protein [Candidatus Woesearchaeota archaeon]